MESVHSCIPIIPSADLARSLRFWVDGLGFEVESEMREENRLTFCMLRRGTLSFMLNRRGGTAAKPEGFEGIRLYWAPTNLAEVRERLKSLGFPVSDILARDYGQTEFFVTDDDGYSHCFGVASTATASR
jgi:catechol 2,3-dioxygenase-like lactoylglutathione lyase family enzyme